VWFLSMADIGLVGYSQLVDNVSQCIADNGDGLMPVVFPPVSTASGAMVPSCFLGVRHPADAASSIRDSWCAPLPLFPALRAGNRW
jgi:hypothetical protein